MKDSEIYLKAAEWLVKNPGHILAYACLIVAPREDHPSRCQHLRKWLGSEYPEQNNDEREYSVLALLFMSEIAKDEEKRK